MVDSYNLESEPGYTKKLCIGMPVYNGELHLRQALDSLLSQTFTDFELIISDNASTDSTPTICQEYIEKDTRIRYVRQPKNIGPYPNFFFVLRQAKSQYFMWAAADDVWEPSFVEKNMTILESNKNIVGSISLVDKFGTDVYQPGSQDPLTKLNKYTYVHPISGSYEEKVAFCLQFRQSTNVYAVYRTEELKKSIYFPHFPLDLAIIINVVRHGDIHVIDEFLMHRFSGGTSTRSVVYELRKQNMSYLELFFMYVPFMIWCIRNLGFKFIIKNIRSIIFIHYLGYGRITLDLLRWIKRKTKF